MQPPDIDSCPKRARLDFYEYWTSNPRVFRMAEARVARKRVFTIRDHHWLS